MARKKTRTNRRFQLENMSTISVILPAECIITVNNYAEKTGSNRSLALEYIIRDWKRMMQKERELQE